MERDESTEKSWSRTQLCGLAVICLLSIVGIAYIARASFRPSAIQPPALRPSAAHASDAKIKADQLNQEADKQTELLLAQLQKSPNDAFLLAEIGKMYYQMRQFHVAAKYYADSVRLKPDPVILVKLGGAYDFDGADDKAIGAWNHALSLEPNNPDALFNIGLVKWHALGNPAAAIAAWQKLLKTNPNHPKRAQVEELLAQARQQLETPAPRSE